MYFIFYCNTELKMNFANVNELAPRKRPKVQASGNVVYIDDKSIPNEYFGNIYLGSEMWRVTVYYDTLSAWNVISSEFDVQISGSISEWQTED